MVPAPFLLAGQKTKTRAHLPTPPPPRPPVLLPHTVASAIVDLDIADPRVAARPVPAGDTTHPHAAHALSAARATLTPADPATGRVRLTLYRISNDTTLLVPGGVTPPVHITTSSFLDTAWPRGATAELRGTPATPGDGRWASVSLVDAALEAGDVRAPAGVVVTGVPATPSSLPTAGALSMTGATLVVVGGSVEQPTVLPPRAAAAVDPAAEWAAGARATAARPSAARPAPRRAAKPGDGVAAAANAYLKPVAP